MKQGSLGYWLDQGNFISFGTKPLTFDNGDIDSFLEALIKSTNSSNEKKILKDLLGYQFTGHRQIRFT